MTDFEKYLDSQFRTDLDSWFRIGNINNPFEAQSAHGLNKYKKPSRCSDTTEHERFFSAAVFFSIMVPEVVAKVTKNNDAMYACCAALNIPFFFAGQIGIIIPYPALRDNYLLPYKNERKYYFPILRDTMHLVLYRFGWFLDQGLKMTDFWKEDYPRNEKGQRAFIAHRYLSKECKEHRQEILDEIVNQVEQFIESIETGEVIDTLMSRHNFMVAPQTTDYYFPVHIYHADGSETETTAKVSLSDGEAFCFKQLEEDFGETLFETAERVFPSLCERIVKQSDSLCIPGDTYDIDVPQELEGKQLHHNTL